ncbi:hypothetical protein N657DRAFT_694007 [Parathielavia appendiculata]|uniref:Uncharacterized protein n=1 Tax=Parathielavia appendiculata TaxID=2587402 RepID=A0AAN6YYR1_9PEZI|nr:hypothetical protein N657DRAFT_694007 [Parathielavia appendiculata]
MSYVKSFSARYADESTIYEQLTKIFPMVTGITIVYQRGRFICTTPRELTDEETKTIKAAIKANHYADEGL